MLCVCEVLLSLEQAVKTARHPSAIARHNAIYFFVCFKVFPPFVFGLSSEAGSDAPILIPGAKAALKQLVVFLWKVFCPKIPPGLVSSAVRLMNCA